MVISGKNRFGESEPLYGECLTLRQKILGPEHPDMSSTLDNLGALYWEHGKIAEAEALYQRALYVKGKILRREGSPS